VRAVRFHLRRAAHAQAGLIRTRARMHAHLQQRPRARAASCPRTRRGANAQHTHPADSPTAPTGGGEFAAAAATRLTWAACFCRMLSLWWHGRSCHAREPGSPGVRESGSPGVSAWHGRSCHAREPHGSPALKAAQTRLHRTRERRAIFADIPVIANILLLAAQHVRQLVFTHKLGQRQASVVLAARVVEVRMVKN
jgi:hypothetical protein